MKFENKMRMSKFTFAKLFMCLIPIIPGYFRIAGQQFRMEFLLLTFVALLVTLKGKLRWSRAMCPYMLIIMVWTLWLAMIEIAHSDYYDALFRIVLWLFVVPMVISCIDTKGKFLKSIDILIITGTIVGIFAIIEEFTSFNIFAMLNTSGIEVETFTRLNMIRVRSFTSHSIIYGVYCMFIMGLMRYRMELPCCNEKFRIFLRIAVCIVFASSILTLSRSPILVIIGSQILLLWFCGRKTFIKQMAKILIIGIAFFVIVSAVSSNAAQMINAAVTLMLGMFNDAYADSLVSMGYGGDTTGISDRLILYQWVWEDVKNHLATGFGPYAWLSHQYVNDAGYSITKTSIEVQILVQLYRYGLLGAVSEMLLYLTLMFSSWKRRKFANRSWEGKLGFNTLCFVIFLAYLIVLFAVTASECMYIFCAMFVLLCAYRINDGFDEARCNK